MGPWAGLDRCGKSRSHRFPITLKICLKDGYTVSPIKENLCLTY